MSEVWVVHNDVDYEMGNLMGLFTTREVALRYAEKCMCGEGFVKTVDHPSFVRFEGANETWSVEAWRVEETFDE